MKKILFLLLLVFPLLTHAQKDSLPVQEGVIRYLLTHSWAKKMAAIDYISKQRRERVAYMWGKEEWKTYANLYFTPTETKYEDSEERAEPDDEGWSWRRETYTIRRNFGDNTQHDAIEMMGKTYLIEDTLQVQAWKIENDLKEVAGHLCMKASCRDTLKNEKIVAWFAMDIPSQAGPERFCGLPGLILEVDINDGALNIMANKMDLKKLTTELDPPKKQKGKKIKEADYFALLQKHIEEKRKDEEPWWWGIRY